MSDIEREELKAEIQHIFDSGANEIRIFEMVKAFIENRNGVRSEPKEELYDTMNKTIHGKISDVFFRKLTVESGYLYDFWDLTIDDYNNNWVFVPHKK